MRSSSFVAFVIMAVLFAWAMVADEGEGAARAADAAPGAPESSIVAETVRAGDRGTSTAMAVSAGDSTRASEAVRDI